MIPFLAENVLLNQQNFCWSNNKKLAKYMLKFPKLKKLKQTKYLFNEENLFFMQLLRKNLLIQQKLSLAKMFASGT